MKLKRKIFNFVKIFLKLFFSIFYKRQYLSGRWFENSLLGWQWALKGLYWQKIMGINREIPWPVSPFIKISNANNITFDINDMNNFWTFGNYFQNFDGKITIGKGTWIAPNVGLITSNHDINDLDKHIKGKDIIIGKDCWIGMNAVILPGVELGDHTIVGAGSIVTKSFPEGNCVIGGNPAKIIKKI